MTLRLLGNNGIDGWSGLVKVVKAICSKGKIKKVSQYFTDCLIFGNIRTCMLFVKY